MRTLEDDLRAARLRADERAQEASAARELLVREQGISTAAQERAAVSERQLGIAQDRLGVLQGTQVIDNLAASEAAQTDVALERALAEVENLKGRIVEAEKHTEQFRLIGSSTEAMLKELRERSMVSKAAQELEVKRLKTESEGLRVELESHKSTTMASEKDIEKARDELLSEKRENVERIRKLEEETLLAKQALEQSGGQMEFLKADILKFQATARSAHGNYERELQLHAKAEKEFSDAQTELDTTKSLLNAAQQASVDLTAAGIRQERATAEEKARIQGIIFIFCASLFLF